MLHCHVNKVYRHELEPSPVCKRKHHALTIDLSRRGPKLFLVLSAGWSEWNIIYWLNGMKRFHKELEPVKLPWRLERHAGWEKKICLNPGLVRQNPFCVGRRLLLNAAPIYDIILMIIINSIWLGVKSIREKIIKMPGARHVSKYRCKVSNPS